MYNGYIPYSLLDIISGRKVKGGVTGDVVINNELIPENFRCASGYVTQVNRIVAVDIFCYYIHNIVCAQEETVTGTLTVKENIMFSAQLRLPRDMTYDEKIEIVDEVIADLGLQNCAHSRVCTMTTCTYSVHIIIRSNIYRLVLTNSEVFLVEKESVQPLVWS